MMYDIYIYRGCTQEPELDELFRDVPELNKDVLLRKLMKKEPGFLGLNLPLGVIKRVLRFLLTLRMKMDGRIYPVRYRDEKPRFTVETAYPIAEKAIKQMQKEFPDVTFSPVRYSALHSSLGNFTFISTSNEWTKEGEALYVNIDVLDGHIWADDEGDELDV
jgi:hypothetical protein